MKTAKLFLAGMYLHLVLSVAAPIGILYLGWGALVAASRGIFILLVPIPICLTWLMVVQSGVTGWLYIRCLRESGEDAAILHSVCQFIPVLDVLSTLLLLRRRRTP